MIWDAAPSHISPELVLTRRQAKKTCAPSPQASPNIISVNAAMSVRLVQGSQNPKPFNPGPKPQALTPKS